MTYFYYTPKRYRNMKSSNGCIYLVHHKDFVDENLPVYKLGKSSQANLKYLKKYPTGSMIAFHIASDNSIESERRLMALFEIKYKRASDFGKGYFVGDKDEMIKDIIYIVRIYSTYIESNVTDKLNRKVLENKDFEEDNKEIMNTHFGSDPNFDILDLGIKRGGLYTRKELLCMAKKCLIYVICNDKMLSKWYGYYPTGIKLIGHGINDWEYSISEGFVVNLKKYMRENLRYGFVVKTLSDIPKPIGENTKERNKK